MAKKVQVFASRGDPGQLMPHFAEHMTHYAQYFSAEQRSPSLIALTLREFGVRRQEFTKPGFHIRVSAADGGSRIVLFRTLAPLTGYFSGIPVVAAAVAILAGIALVAMNPADWRSVAPFLGGAFGVLLVGLVLRQFFYWLEGARDRELAGIVQKALADLGRPTAIRRREQSAGAGPGTSQPA